MSSSAANYYNKGKKAITPECNNMGKSTKMGATVILVLISIVLVLMLISKFYVEKEIAKKVGADAAAITADPTLVTQDHHDAMVKYQSQIGYVNMVGQLVAMLTAGWLMLISGKTLGSCLTNSSENND